ncbi:MAG: single-stranded-DNA-specific exonuclease RecJ [Paludibacteraceae bacterium]|nr:single-stranded-DNA-specific exonuclease RecJ [Paludibacteraceae bacterium]
MIHKWIINELTPEQKACKETLLKETSFSPTICELLAKRGISDKKSAEAFFCPTKEQIHDPALYNDMDKAVERLDKAMRNNEKVLVYGDYDVDGTTAVALVYKFLTGINFTNIDFYIPDRYDEGYGVSYKGIDYAAEHGFSLMIVLDCGIKAVEKVKYAKEKNIDIIICDHHTPDEVLPDAVAVLDAKRTDSTYPYRELSGCGVGFKFMQAVAKSNNIPADHLEALLDLLAISIASDIVPITGENRALMTLGLKRLNTNPCIGVRAILKVCELDTRKDITTSDIVFKIGPRINASGRMSSGREAVELLISKNLDDAMARSGRINTYNQERKELDKTITEQAKEQIASNPDFKNLKSTVVYNKDWSKGVIGIVASRLSETYFRPTVVLTRSNGFVTGSARSVSGFDIYKAIDSCRDLLENFGGHIFAAGLTLKEENVEEFKRRFDLYVQENMGKEQYVPQIEADTEISLDEITPEFFNTLQKFAPFGPENLKPVFITNNVIDHGSKRVGKELDHLKVEVADPQTGACMNGIAFGMGKEFYEHLHSGKPVGVCYTVEENDFNGRKTLQLMVKDIKKQ